MLSFCYYFQNLIPRKKNIDMMIESIKVYSAEIKSIVEQ
jgi:hypothetical protein